MEEAPGNRAKQTPPAFGLDLPTTPTSSPPTPTPQLFQLPQDSRPWSWLHLGAVSGPCLAGGLLSRPWLPPPGSPPRCPDQQSHSLPHDLKACVPSVEGSRQTALTGQAEEAGREPTGSWCRRQGQPSTGSRGTDRSLVSFVFGGLAPTPLSVQQLTSYLPASSSQFAIGTPQYAQTIVC